MADRLLLESSAVDGYLLEDGSGVLLLNVSAYRAAVEADSPVSYWRLGDTDAILRDTVGTNHGTYGAGTKGEPGAIASDDPDNLSYRTTGGMGTVPWAASLNLGNGPLSYEIWFKFSSSGTVAGTFELINIADAAGPYFTVTSNVVRWWSTADGANMNGSALTDGLWHHVVGTKSAANVWLLYIDGVDRTGTSGAATSAMASGNITFGGPVGATFPGWVDEAALYNTVLSPTRVLAHYNAAVGVAAAISGTGATTQAAQAAAGNARLRFLGPAADIQAAQTASGGAKLRFSASGAASQAKQTASGAARLDFRASGTAVQTIQTASGTGREAFRSTGTTAQAGQTAVGTGRLRLAGSGASAQAGQTANGAGRLTFRATGATSQASQAATATGRERFIASGASTQAPQTEAGAGHTPAVGISGSGASAQAVQTEAGAGQTPLAGISGTGATVQAAQIASGIGSLPSGVVIAGGGSGGGGHPYYRQQAPRRLEAPDPFYSVPRLIIRGHGATSQHPQQAHGGTQQHPQQAHGRGRVTDIEAELLLLAA